MIITDTKNHADRTLPLPDFLYDLWTSLVLYKNLDLGRQIYVFMDYPRFDRHLALFAPDLLNASGVIPLRCE